MGAHKSMSRASVRRCSAGGARKLGNFWTCLRSGAIRGGDPQDFEAAAQTDLAFERTWVSFLRPIGNVVTAPACVARSYGPRQQRRHFAACRARHSGYVVPGANYFLGFNRYPSAREFIDAGVPVGLATDYNPGSLLPPASFGCRWLHAHEMSPAEAVAAGHDQWRVGTRLQDRKGSIEPGKDADWQCRRRELS